MQPAVLSILLAITSSLSAQGGFAPWREGIDPAPRRARLEVEESPGSLLRAAGNHLLRIRDGSETELDCIVAGGMGTIRCLALHPSGTTFIAADKGLFITHSEVETVDAVLYRDGVPAGKPIGVHVDRWDRLWLATESGFGAVHTSQFFGRSFGSKDGLPEPPFTSFGVAQDGSLVLGNAEGLHRYLPDQGPRPTLGTVTLQGQVVATSAPFALEGSDFAADIRGQGTGQISERWRRSGHHLLRPLDAAGIRELVPGSHLFEFYAMDRDLNLSAPRTIELQVAYPKSYSKVTLLSAIGGTMLLLLAALLLLARKKGLPLGRTAFGNGFILSMLGLQFLGAYLAHGRSYPFIGFTMYTEVASEGSLSFTPVFKGIYANGQREEMSPDYRSYTTLGTWNAISHLLYGSEEDRRAFVADYRKGDPWGRRPIVGFELRTERHRLTAEGPRRVAPLILLEWSR